MRKHPRFPLDNTGSSRSPQTAPPPRAPEKLHVFPEGRDVFGITTGPWK